MQYTSMTTSLLESAANVRILVLPVGQMSPDVYDRYLTILGQFNEVGVASLTPSMSSAPPGERRAFLYRSWHRGTLRLDFTQAVGDQPYMDLQPGRKIMIVLGVCHCPSTRSITVAHQVFSSACHDYPTAMMHKLFAFDVTEDHLNNQSEFTDLQNLATFLPDRTMEEGKSLLEMQLQMTIATMCSGLLEIIEARVERGLVGKLQPPPRLQTTADAKANARLSQQKRARRQAARLRKWAGDYCLLAAAPQDAALHYRNAIDAMKAEKPADSLWLAAAHEGYATALLLDAVDKYHEQRGESSALLPQRNKIRNGGGRNATSSSRAAKMLELDPLVEEHCKSALVLYKASGSIELQISIRLKLAHYYASVKPYSRPPKELMKQGDPAQVETRHNRFLHLEAMKLLSEVMTELYPKLRIEARAHIQIEAALLSEAVGMSRKFSYYIHSAAMLYCKAKNWPAAHYLVQLSGQNHGIQPWNSGSVLRGKASRWPQVRRQLLLELMRIARAMHKPKLAITYAIALLLTIVSVSRRARTCIGWKWGGGGTHPVKDEKGRRKIETKDGLNRLVLPADHVSAQIMVRNEIRAIEQKLPAPIVMSMPGIPAVHSAEALPSSVSKSCKTRPKRGCDGTSDGPASRHKYSKIFYNPFESSNNISTAVSWIQGEDARVKLYLSNPLCFEIEIKSIALIVEGADVEAYPRALTLPAMSENVESILSMKPLETGEATIVGCRVQCLGSICEHYFASTELAATATILAPVPLLVVRDVELHAARSISSASAPVTTLTLLDGQIHSHCIVLENVGFVSVGFVSLKMKVMTAECVSEAVVLDSSADAAGSSAGATDAFIWDNAALGQVKGNLPLNPGATLSFPVTIDAHKDIKAAELVVEYAMSDAPGTYVRSLILPFRMLHEPALRLMGIDVLPFGDAAMRTLPSGTRLRGAAESDSGVAIVVLTVENPTIHPFELMCTTVAMGSDKKYSKQNDFAMTFEGKCCQRISLPILRSVFTGIETGGDVESDSGILARVDAAVRMRWKASHGSCGSLHVLKSGVALTKKMKRRLAPCNIRIEWKAVAAQSMSSCTMGPPVTPLKRDDEPYGAAEPHSHRHRVSGEYASPLPMSPKDCWKLADKQRKLAWPIGTFHAIDVVVTNVHGEECCEVELCLRPDSPAMIHSGSLVSPKYSLEKGEAFTHRVMLGVLEGGEFTVSLQCRGASTDVWAAEPLFVRGIDDEIR